MNGEVAGELFVGPGGVHQSHAGDLGLYAANVATDLGLDSASNGEGTSGFHGWGGVVEASLPPDT